MDFSLKPLDQDYAWSRLAELAKDIRKIPQALLFLGPAGAGKKQTARAFFQYINCANPLLDSQSPCGQCSSCSKIFHNHHTDLVEVSPEGDQILVDDLRDLQRSLYFAPIEAKQRLIIINQAHLLGVSAANSLLKTLEEPPIHTRFILITHERSLLLPTILSRCQYLRFIPKSQAVAPSENELDQLVLSTHAQMLALLQQNRPLSEIYPLANKAFRAVYLRKRLDHRANKKLIALATAGLRS